MKRLTFCLIRGKPLIGGPTEQIEKTPAVAPLKFARVRSVRGNPYLQTKGPATALASLLAVRCGQLRPMYHLENVPGVPQLRLNDLATFRNQIAQGVGNVKTGVVLGIHSQGGPTTGFSRRSILWT